MGLSKTFVLMLGLILLFMYIGQLLGGPEGMKTAFWFACGINFFSYFFSDKLVLAHYQAKAVDEKTEPKLYHIVKKLAERANLPMPKVYIIPEQTPNAFATGRNPSHSAVAATQGLLNLMNDDEIEGVLAHEMSHIKHRDILISTIAATFAGAISYLSRSAQRNAYGRNNRKSGIFVLIALILMPVAAFVIQMSVSRTREYAADAGAAQLTGHPEWLAGALEKLEGYAKENTFARATSSSAHIFIVNPLRGGVSRSLLALFSTHPSTESRIERLMKMRTF